jgi:multidrug resistance efflux pump
MGCTLSPFADFTGNREQYESQADFAVLPPENATGNWVKVVQHLPVRLELDELDPNGRYFRA